MDCAGALRSGGNEASDGSTAHVRSRGAETGELGEGDRVCSWGDYEQGCAGLARQVSQEQS